MTEEMRTVKIRFGPYEAHGVVSHRKGRLKGLCEELVGLGLSYVLRPWHHWDRVQMSICGHVAFECKLTNLRFNTMCGLDPVCQRAVEAIVDMADRIEDADNVRLVGLDKEEELQGEEKEEIEEQVAEEVVEEQEEVPSQEIVIEPAKLIDEIDEDAPEELINTITDEGAGVDPFAALAKFRASLTESSKDSADKLEKEDPPYLSPIREEPSPKKKASFTPSASKPRKFSTFSDVVEVREDEVSPVLADSDDQDGSDSSMKKSPKFALNLDIIEDEEKPEAKEEVKIPMLFTDDYSDSNNDSFTSPADRPRKTPMFADEVDVVDDIFDELVVDVIPGKIDRIGRVMLPEEAEEFFIPLKPLEELFPLPKE